MLPATWVSPLYVEVRDDVDELLDAEGPRRDDALPDTERNGQRRRSTRNAWTQGELKLHTGGVHFVDATLWPRP